MDEADDAIGRVAIFSVERAAAPDLPVAPLLGRDRDRPAPRWIGVVDDPRGAVVLAVCLVLLLVLGLRLTH